MPHSKLPGPAQKATAPTKDRDEGLLIGRAALRRTLGIEALLVWTYRDQMARRVGRLEGPHEAEAGAGGLGCRHSGYGCEAVAGDAGAAGADIHPDAEIVHMMVCALPDRIIAGLVMQCGGTGSRPDWGPVAVQRLPAWPWRKLGVAASRELYCRWRGTLVALQSTLLRRASCLILHRVDRSLPPEKPWEATDSPHEDEFLPGKTRYL